jgi:Cd2+/Zn2+-exporting ATPase/Cu+-exporting ATPase
MIDRLRVQGKALLFVQVGQQTAGVMAAADVPREETGKALKDLAELGIREIMLLSGDHETAVRHLADGLGIPFRAGLLPEEKIAIIQEAQCAGRVVAMVGDGVNDAPALAQADVGIAMGQIGSDLANESASISLMREDWALVPQLFRTARRTMRVVRGNILFTAAYNLIGLTLAAFGFLPPSLAAAMQSLPDLGILANSARLVKAG